MDYGKEFEKFATKDQGINSNYYSKIIESMYPTNLTPNIIEERQMNIAIFDVFSRLMMDRIIFLGTGVNDQVANIIQAQLLFLQSVDASKDVQIYINSPGGSVYAGSRYLRYHAVHKARCSNYLYWYSSVYGSSIVMCWSRRQAFGIKTFTSYDSPTDERTQGQVSDMEIAVRETLKVKKNCTISFLTIR